MVLLAAKGVRTTLPLRCNASLAFALYCMSSFDGTAGTDPAVVMEFKAFDPDEEATLKDTVARARAQIEEKPYVSSLVARGIAPERIRTYGIAFRGKEVLVG